MMAISIFNWNRRMRMKRWRRWRIKRIRMYRWGMMRASYDRMWSMNTIAIIKWNCRMRMGIWVNEFSTKNMNRGVGMKSFNRTCVKECRTWLDWMRMVSMGS